MLLYTFVARDVTWLKSKHELDVHAGQRPLAASEQIAQPLSPDAPSRRGGRY